MTLQRKATDGSLWLGDRRQHDGAVFVLSEGIILDPSQLCKLEAGR